MKRTPLVILSLLLSCLAFAAQDSLHIYKDTLDARTLTLTSGDDDLLLNLVEQQSRRLAHQNDSVAQLRMVSDVTTLVPLHLGYADSLRIAARLEEMGYTSVLCLPQIYIPQSVPSFQPLSWSPIPQAPSDTFLLPESMGQPVQNARRYLTAHAANLYTGVFDPSKVVHYEDADNVSLYELSVPTRSIVQDDEEDRAELARRIRNRNSLWFKEADLMLQVTQNYVSGNWYEGGNSAFAIYSHVEGTVKYDDKKRISWVSTGAWTAGATTVSGDSLRKVNCNEDLLRLYSKFGVKVAKKLYVSASAELRTQLFPTFKTNSPQVKTSFLTPLRLNLTLGIDYQPISGLSIVFSPLAYKMVYANDTLRAPYTTYGIASGKNLLSELGSSTRVEWTWQPLREISLDTKFYAYTNYKMIELDLELACNFIINRFISARVVLHPRYDSSHIMEGDERAKFQFKELVSVGFAHKFH